MTNETIGERRERTVEKGEQLQRRTCQVDIGEVEFSTFV